MNEQQQKRMEAMLAWARANEKDESDQPDLQDQFVKAPPAIQSLISAAGGNADGVVAWFECDGRPIFRFVVHGEMAVDAWRALRAKHNMSGYWPVILGPNGSIEGHNNLRSAEEDHSMSAILDRSQKIDAKSWQAATWSERKEDRDNQRPTGETWPDESEVEKPAEFSAFRSTILQKPLKQIWIGLLPIKHSWEAAAAMRFGDWNEVPSPEVHVAIHREWEQEFGAELVSMTNDVLEFQVSRPPKTRDAAMELAELHFDYCPDIVDQGVQSIKALALSLLNCNIWYFWWD